MWFQIKFIVSVCLFCKKIQCLECHVDEERPIGTTLINSLTGTLCNVLQIKSMSSSAHMLYPNSIRIKILLSQQNEINSYFRIINEFRKKSFGDVQVNKLLDLETLCQAVGTCCESESFCLLKLTVMIKRPIFQDHRQTLSLKPGWIIETIHIKLMDVNDNSPQFTPINKIIELSETAQIGIKILLPLAMDIDSSIFNIHSYRLEGNDPQMFQLIQDWSMPESSITQIFLKLLKPLDREVVPSYLLKLIAVDKGNPPRSGFLTIEIKILDANDNHPIFENQTYHIYIKETESNGYMFLQLKATDQDTGDNGNILYSFSSDMNVEECRKFHIDPVTGWISLLESLDYEKVKQYKLTIIARDMGLIPTYAKTIVKIDVLDFNDNFPKIYLEYLIESGKRSLLEGPITTPKEYAMVIVTDPDTGSGGIFQCELTGSFKFELTKQSSKNSYPMKINLISELDYERNSVEKLKIICNDLGNPKLTSSYDDEVAVIDINDNAPTFEKDVYKVKIDENNQLGIVLIKVKAVDKDSGINGKVVYMFDQNGTLFLSIDKNSGIIRSKIIFDREKKSQYKITVLAKDSGNPPLSSLTTIFLSISDINDNIPTFQGLNVEGSYLFQVNEDMPIGSIVGKVYADDPDEGKNGYVIYSLISISETFSIDQNDGNIKITHGLDRETSSSHQLFVRVTDKGVIRQENSVSVVINILDINDNEPRILFPTRKNNTITISYFDIAGILIAKIEAIDNDEGLNAFLEYQIISGNSRGSDQESLFNIDSKNGVLILQRHLSQNDMGIYDLRIMVSDQGSPPLTTIVNFIIKIDDSPQRTLAINRGQYNLNRIDGYSSTFRDDSLSTSVIFIISIAFICIIILILLTLAMFLCGKRGQEDLLEMCFNRGDTSNYRELCFCFTKRNQTTLRPAPLKYSEMFFNNSTLLLKSPNSSSDIENRSNKTLSTSYHQEENRSIRCDKNCHSKPSDCKNYQIRSLRMESGSDCNTEAKYISFNRNSDIKKIDLYTTLVSFQGNKAKYERKENHSNKPNTSDNCISSPIEPIVYIRSPSTVKNNNNSEQFDAKREVLQLTKLHSKSLTLKTLPQLNHQSNSGDILQSLKKNYTDKIDGYSEQLSPVARSKYHISRFPSVPESLNYLTISEPSRISQADSYDRLQHRLLIWDAKSRIKKTDLHRGSFV